MPSSPSVARLLKALASASPPAWPSIQMPITMAYAAKPGQGDAEVATESLAVARTTSDRRVSLPNSVEDDDAIFQWKTVTSRTARPMFHDESVPDEVATVRHTPDGRIALRSDSDTFAWANEPD